MRGRRGESGNNVEGRGCIFCERADVTVTTNEDNDLQFA